MSIYRLKIEHPTRGNSYIIRDEKRVVRYIASDETPLALSNLILRDAAAMRFKLEDAFDGNSAAKALREVLAQQHKGYPVGQPTVEVL